jgi:hypothetical protein
MLITARAITVVILVFAALAIVQAWPVKLARLWSVAWSLIALLMLVELWEAQHWYEVAVAWEKAYWRDIGTSQSRLRSAPQLQSPQSQPRDSACGDDPLFSTESLRPIIAGVHRNHQQETAVQETPIAPWKDCGNGFGVAKELNTEDFLVPYQVLLAAEPHGLRSRPRQYFSGFSLELPYRSWPNTSRYNGQMRSIKPYPSKRSYARSPDTTLIRAI